MKPGQLCFCLLKSLFWQEGGGYSDVKLSYEDAVIFLGFHGPRCYDEIEVLTKYGFGIMNVNRIVKRK